MENREIILYILHCLSNIEFQKKVWQNNEQFDTYCSSFGEAVNSLDDFNFFDNIEDKKFAFSDKIYLELENYLEEIIDYQENDEMLADSNWINLTIRARHAFNQLKNIITWYR